MSGGERPGRPATIRTEGRVQKFFKVARIDDPPFG